MKIHWFFSSLLSSLSVLLMALSAEAAKLQSWQFDDQQNRLTFTTDEPVNPQVQLLDDPMRLVIDLPDTELERRRDRENGEGAIDEIEVRRIEDNLARIVIELENDYIIDPGRVVVQGVSPTTWIVQLPPAQRVRDRDRRSRDDDAGIPIAVTPYVAPSVIEAIELAESGNLTIRSDRPVETYSSGWDQATASYQIRLSRSQLGRGVGSPTVSSRSPALRVRVRQESEDVVIAIQPAPGVQVGELTQANQTLSLALIGRAQRQFLPGDRAATRVFPPLNQLPQVTNQRVVIAIDPGHGGRDPGAVGIGGLRETDIVLDVSLQMADLLRAQGVEVILTRQDEREIDLEPRVSTANRGNADLFVSIHANAISMSRPDVNGVETYFYGSPAGRALSDVILQSILEATNMRSRGVKEARFYVLRRTAMPATLVEVGFVTGAEDAPRLADPEFRTLIAQAITRGILQYVVENF